MVKRLEQMDQQTYLIDDIKDWFNRRPYRRLGLQFLGVLAALGLIAFIVIEFG